MAALNPNTAVKPTVCILTAGKGSRMGESLPINKALLPINGKAIISGIIEKFPTESSFVIALGHASQQVKDFLCAAHPDRSFQFVQIQKREGLGSGPGRSLQECAPYLPKSFYFAACDIEWQGEIPLQKENSWIAVAQVAQEAELLNYCNAVIDPIGTVTRFVDKCIPLEKNTKVFTGLAFIKDANIFFSALDHAEPVQSELQVSSGLRGLIPHSLETVEIPWRDLGTWEKYRAAASEHENFDFSKSDEFLFLYPKTVIKFFSDPKIAYRRVARARQMPQAFPPITYTGEQIYAYAFTEGQTLYEAFSPEKIRVLFNWLEKNLWINPPNAHPEIKSLCIEFYQNKTKQRIQKWRQRYPQFSEHRLVNSVETASLYQMLEKIPWDIMYDGLSSFIHGDLQPDNILCTKDGFLLLDWRQDFAGALNIGDLYYDLAKLRGGLLVNYRLIKEGKFFYQENKDSCEFQIPSYRGQNEAIAIFDNYILDKGYDLKKIKWLNAIIFTNMAPLHAAPFDKLLWALARETLQKEICIL